MPRPALHDLCFGLLERILPMYADSVGEDADESLAHALMDFVNASMIPQFFSGLRMAIRVVCERSSDQHHEQDDSLRNEVLVFVRERFTDNSLSLELLSQRFGFSSYYWSRYFKEIVGQNFSDYVWQLRLALAKELLSTPMNINEVVAKVGYLDARSFIRKFKNCEGVTPAQYKRSSNP